jgi:hypothetical protein
LALELLLRFVEETAVEDASLGEPYRTQAFLQIFLAELLGAENFDLRDGRAFLHDDDEHAVVDFRG